MNTVDVIPATVTGLLSGAEPSLLFCAQVLGIPPEEYNPAVHYPQYIATRALQIASVVADHANAVEFTKGLL